MASGSNQYAGVNRGRKARAGTGKPSAARSRRGKKKS